MPAADVIIASSTSGLTPTDLQRDMVAPERFCVAHPFNPVYLLPLVELVGGAKTAPATIEAAAEFFTYIGMHALRVRREVPGHLTDRLQEAHVARDPAHGERRGRDHGRARRIHHLRSRTALGGHGHESDLSPRRRRDRHAAHAGAVRTVPEMAVDQARGAGAHRDADRPHGRGHPGAGGRPLDPRARAAARRLSGRHSAGAAPVRHRRGLDVARARGAALSRMPATARRDRPADAAEDRAVALRWTTVVRPEWVDYNGHMSDFRYGQVFGDAMDALYRRVGIDEAYRASGRMYYTVESHVRHLGEAKVGEAAVCHHAGARASTTSACTFSIACIAARDDALIATGEQMHLHVDTTRGQGGRRWIPAVRAKLETLASSTAALGPCRAGGREARRQPRRSADACRRSSIMPKRRDEIAHVACQVVAKHGFEQATVARIARAAGYTTGMVAHYYESKQDIILAALRLILLRIEERLTRERDAARRILLNVLSEALRHRRAALHRVRILDGVLGPGVGRPEAQAPERLGAP